MPGRESLHHRIVTGVERRILTGVWPPGFRIPSEHELAGEYGCSRMTVNKALTQVAKAGYIERRRRAGSFVRQPQAQSAVLDIHDIAAEVATLGLRYRHEVIAWRVHRGDDIDRQRLELAEDATMLGVAVVHHAGESPFCLEERIVNLAAVPEVRSADFTGEPPGTWLLRQVPWQTAEHTISARPADTITARRLDLAAGTSCLVIERRTWNAEHIVTYVRLTYPGDRHALVARFSPSGQ